MSSEIFNPTSPPLRELQQQFFEMKKTPKISSPTLMELQNQCKVRNLSHALETLTAESQKSPMLSPMTRNRSYSREPSPLPVDQGNLMRTNNVHPRKDQENDQSNEPSTSAENEEAAEDHQMKKQLSNDIAKAYEALKGIEKDFGEIKKKQEDLDQKTRRRMFIERLDSMRLREPPVSLFSFFMGLFKSKPNPKQRTIQDSIQYLMKIDEEFIEEIENITKQTMKIDDTISDFLKVHKTQFHDLLVTSADDTKMLALGLSKMCEDGIYYGALQDFKEFEKGNLLDCQSKYYGKQNRFSKSEDSDASEISDTRDWIHYVTECCRLQPDRRIGRFYLVIADILDEMEKTEKINEPTSIELETFRKADKDMMELVDQVLFP